MNEVINKIKLNADLVVLSSCETGLGDVLEGEGVMSMTRAFQLSGASSVVASLWKVHENATQLFMLSFYKYINEGKPPIKALHLTKKDFIDNNIKNKNTVIDYSHPFFWSAFVLVGGK